MKRFAFGCTGGPDIVNLQLGFWKNSIATFKFIKEQWEKCAVEENGRGTGSDKYTEDDFKVHAARGIVEAGTSLSILVGQNVPPEEWKGRQVTPSLRGALAVLLESLDGTAEEFIRIYDDIRHFGLAKHETIEELTEEKYCALMTTAQSLWKRVLVVQGMSERGFFDDEFRFE